ncbi:MAG: hypothetical protein ACKOFG_13455 [Limnohabitans sp.]
MQQLGLYEPRWTTDIEQEFTRNWARVVTGLKGAALKAYEANVERAKDPQQAANRLGAFRSAVGVEWEILGHDAPGMTSLVPVKVNKGDVHVVAAAIRLKAVLATEGSPADKVFIVSANLKHLAVRDTAKLGIEVVGPGAFVDRMCAIDTVRLEAALAKSVKDLKKPPYTRAELLDALELHGATATVAHFRKVWKI